MNDVRKQVVRVAPASQFAHVSTPEAIAELNTRVTPGGCGRLRVRTRRAYGSS